MRTPGERLREAARAHGVDDRGLSDREVALVVLVKLGCNIDQPNARGSIVPIKAAPDESLIWRGIVWAETTEARSCSI